MVEICVVQGNIIDMPVDYIVNAANPELWMGSGVAGAIKWAAGLEVEQEAMKLAPIEHGAAVLTSSGKLPHKGIIHAAAMSIIGLVTKESLRRSFGEIEAILREVDANSVAIPALGTGVGGFSMEEFCKIALESLQSWQWNGKVIMVAYSDNALATFYKTGFKACMQ